METTRYFDTARAWPVFSTGRWHRMLSLFLLPLALLVGTTVPAFADEPAPRKSVAKYEVRFMTNMIDHHQMAIMMAEMCQAKALHEELRSLCLTIQTTQQQEIMTMRSWLSDWYGVSYVPDMTRGDMQRMERMAALPPAEFEDTFLKSMTRHHWKAVIRASQCVARAYHDPLKNLCEQIVVAQIQEIQQMKSWLCQWYGLCHYGPSPRSETEDL